MNKKHLAAVRGYIAELGGANISIRQGRRHFFVEFDWQGKRRAYPVAGTPSDCRALLNAKSEIRHLMGIERGEKPPPATERKRPRTVRRRYAEAPAVTPGRDMWAPLANHPMARR